MPEEKTPEEVKAEKIVEVRDKRGIGKVRAFLYVKDGFSSKREAMKEALEVAAAEREEAKPKGGKAKIEKVKKEVETPTLVLSIVDHFEGESLTIAATCDGEEITGTESGHCNGKIAKSDLKVCVKEIEYAYDPASTYAFSINYEGDGKTMMLLPGEKSAALYWGEE